MTQQLARPAHGLNVSDEFDALMARLDDIAPVLRRNGEANEAGGRLTPEVAGTEWALGILARSQALLADHTAAEPLYREAIERLTRSGVVVHLARARLVCGEWLRRRNRPREGREQLRSAYEAFTGMGARAFAERAHGELLATGETVRSRTVTSRPVLTAQEAQIARLCAGGCTNQEIGARLFISPKTVEYHLSKVFTKLGISSRRDIRDALSASVTNHWPASATARGRAD